MNGRLSLGALMATGAYIFLHSRTSIEKEVSTSEFSWLLGGFFLMLPEAL